MLYKSLWGVGGGYDSLPLIQEAFPDLLALLAPFPWSEVLFHLHHLLFPPCVSA